MPAVGSGAPCRKRRCALRRLACGLALGGAALALGNATRGFVAAPGTEKMVRQGLDPVMTVPAAASAALMVPVEAWAKGGAMGPLEGKASSLVHPFIMPVLFLVTLYTGFLGWQWRQVRVVGYEIQDLRKQVPKQEDPEAEVPASVKAIQEQIKSLTAQRSELQKGQYKDRHFQMSSVILGGGIFFVAYGVCNTYFRTEKLFPGPHLYAGAAIVVVWALAAAMVPWMEKGNDTARTAHIALNVLNLGLFVWQLPTGFEIFLKVWGNANLAWF